MNILKNGLERRKFAIVFISACLIIFTFYNLLEDILAQNNATPEKIKRVSID